MLVHSLQMSVHICPVPGSWDITLKNVLRPNATDSSPSKCEVGREAQSSAGLESLNMRSDTGKER